MLKVVLENEFLNKVLQFWEFIRPYLGGKVTGSTPKILRRYLIVNFFIIYHKTLKPSLFVIAIILSFDFEFESNKMTPTPPLHFLATGLEFIITFRKLAFMEFIELRRLKCASWWNFYAKTWIVAINTYFKQDRLNKKRIEEWCIGSDW